MKKFDNLLKSFTKTKRLGDYTYYLTFCFLGGAAICHGTNRILKGKWEITKASIEKMIKEHALSDEELQILSDILDRS